MYHGYGRMLLNILAFAVNRDIELGDSPVMEWGYSTRLHCNSHCSLEGISSSTCQYWVGVGGIYYFYVKKDRENVGNFIFISVG